MPNWLPAEAWTDWHEYRKKTTKGWTPKAQLLSLATLTKLRSEGHDPVKVIEASIEKGWNGLFPISSKTPNEAPTMQTNASPANHLLSTAPASTVSTTSGRPALSSDAAAPAQWLRRLWERMTALYGHAWVPVHGVSPQSADSSLTVHGDTWAGILSSLNSAQIGRGLEACMASGAEFPPSAPRFRAMCLQIPSIAAVRAEYRNAVGSRNGPASPFARLVHQFLEHGRYREGDWKTADKILRDAYELASDHLLRGGSYPPEPVAAIARATVISSDRPRKRPRKNARSAKRGARK